MAFTYIPHRVVMELEWLSQTGDTQTMDIGDSCDTYQTGEFNHCVVRVIHAGMCIDVDVGIAVVLKHVRGVVVSAKTSNEIKSHINPV